MLHIHRAERADGLIDALRAILADPLPDPFAPEVIAVPTRGIERWVSQRLSSCLGASAGRADGVCANVDFPSPRRLVGEAVAAACGIAPETDPWLPERAVWPLLEVVDEYVGEPWLADLSAYLAGGQTAARRLSTVRHIAELFDRYARLRPEMVRSWADGQGGHWQAELWRRMRERVSKPSPAERLQAAAARLAADPTVVDLPPRLAVFGLTRLPAGQLDLFRALAVSRDVHVLLLHPSPALWDAVADWTARRALIRRRAEDSTGDLPRNRLLASWGQDSREMQLVLTGGQSDHGDHHHPVDHPSDTLLARIQADIRADRAPTFPAALDPADDSIQVHACHGRARQVEVLRDAILHVLQDDPTLEPRDVIVMCPDIETFAPLIHATFGAGDLVDDEEVEPLPADLRPVDLRVRLADRSLRQTNPVLGVVAQLIDLADERVTASQVIDLADREPVRQRFRFDDDNIARLQDWIAKSGVRWGLDAAHRAPFKLDSLPAGTWRAGLSRLLLGVAMTEDERRRFAGVLPLDDVQSMDIDLAGRFAELVERLQNAIDAFRTPQTIDRWAQTIATAADALTSTFERDAWQRAQLQRLLDDVVAEAAGNATPVALQEVRALLGERLQGRPTRANFRTGHLTICTLVPMRSVPHRVVCLLGLDDGVFPRKPPRDGDDLLLDDPHVGDRDPRTEDRQLLLDALMAATDRLIISYTGNDERTNMAQPPAVPVDELLDVIDATARVQEGRARERVVIRHPLQPFDAGNFIPGRLVAQRTWSFDTVAREGARALTGDRADPPGFLESPLPPLEHPLVEVEDLVRFVSHPVRAFLRQRLGMFLTDFSQERDDDLPIELDGLERWAVGDRLLEAQLSGVDGRTAALAEIARGTLPPGLLGKPVIEDVLPLVEAIAQQARAEVAGSYEPASIDVRIALPDGRILGGTVAGVVGDVLRNVTYSRVGAKHRLAAWVRLLALTAAYPHRAFAAVTVGRGDKTRVRVARIAPLGADAALEHLATLIDLYDRGMREPLPVFCNTSAEYARVAAAGGDPVRAARGKWASGFRYTGEDSELEHLLVLGGVLPFEELFAQEPRHDEAGEGWDISDKSRLGRCARRMWDGLLSCEEVSDV